MSEEEKTEKKKCRYCFEQIDISASVCHYCNRYQNPVRQHLRFERLAVYASIVMVLIAYSQFREARKEHIAAKDALEQATRAEETASSAYEAGKVALEQATRATRAEVKAILADDATEEITQALIRIAYLKQRARMYIVGPRPKEIDKLIQDDLNRILRLMFPDPNERRTFVQKLKNDLPKRE